MPLSGMNAYMCGVLFHNGFVIVHMVYPGVVDTVATEAFGDSDNAASAMVLLLARVWKVNGQSS